MILMVRNLGMSRSGDLPIQRIWVPIQKEFRVPHKVKRSHKLCDVSKGAACIKMAAAKLGWVGRSRRLVSITRTPELDFFIGLPRPARYLCVYSM